MNPKIPELLQAIDLGKKLETKINELKEYVRNNCGGNCIYYDRHKEYSSGGYYDSSSFHIYMKCSLCGKYELIEKG